MKLRSPGLLLSLSLIASAPAAIAQTGPTTLPSGSANSLSEVQKQAIKRIKVSSELRAAPIALRLARIVNEIYDNMLAVKPDEKLRAQLSEQMKTTTWELLSIKGQAIRETVNVLTPEQRQLIKIEKQKPGAPADLSEVIEKTFQLNK